MASIYFLTFEPGGVDRDAVLDFLETNAAVTDYHASVPTNFIIIVSPLTAIDLGNSMKGKGGMQQFAMSRIDGLKVGPEMFGWMPQDVWDFVNRHSVADLVTPIQAVPPVEAAK